MQNIAKCFDVLSDLLCFRDCYTPERILHKADLAYKVLDADLSV